MQARARLSCILIHTYSSLTLVALEYSYAAEPHSSATRVSLEYSYSYESEYQLHEQEYEPYYSLILAALE